MYMHVFMTTIWQSSQIWKTRRFRQTQLKTILPCSYVVDSKYHHTVTTDWEATTIERKQQLTWTSRWRLWYNARPTRSSSTWCTTKLRYYNTRWRQSRHLHVTNKLLNFTHLLFNFGMEPFLMWQNSAAINLLVLGSSGQDSRQLLQKL